MGNSLGCNMTLEEKQERILNKQIANSNRKQQERRELITKVLLLGTGESGKSTIFKQARELFGKGFTPREYEQFRPKVFNNIVLQLCNILDARANMEIPYENPECAGYEKRLKKLKEGSDPVKEISTQMAEACLKLWNDKGVQAVWQRRSRYQVFDCIEYFLQEENMKRISEQGERYIPTFQDIVQCRDRTTGIIVEKFKMNDADFEMYDVGGQRSERRKWLACFDHVTTVIFVTAINEYDQSLFEESAVNRISEALRVFRDIVNRDDFKRIGFVLFFNKMDLFEKKVCEFPFRVLKGDQSSGEQIRNEDYDGMDPMQFKEGDPRREQAIQQCYRYMNKMFMDAVDQTGRTGAIHIHPTVATDSKTMDHVFNNCQEQILSSYLHSRGFAHAQY